MLGVLGGGVRGVAEQLASGTGSGSGSGGSGSGSGSGTGSGSDNMPGVAGRIAWMRGARGRLAEQVRVARGWQWRESGCGSAVAVAVLWLWQLWLCGTVASDCFITKTRKRM
jgi:hypothetical protein